jgi:hypothetical protein
VTENFDSLGRVRTMQRLFDANGTLVDEKPVNTRAIPHLMNVTTTMVDGAPEVTRLMKDSGQVDACFTRQYFRFTFQRPEELARDGCALAAIQDAALSGASIADLWKAIALRPEFAQRDFR